MEIVREVVREVVRTVHAPPQAPLEHPVLGLLLHDFGYKRVYAMLSARLTDGRCVAVWNQQRSFRLARAEAIARAKAPHAPGAALGLPGVVTLYELGGGASPFRAILDGQHRVGALRLLLCAPAPSPFPYERVLVEVYPLGDEGSAEALFCEINSAQPVLPVDLPPSGGGAPVGDKGALEGACAALAARWPAMFKASPACKAPHVNADALRDALFRADVLRAHGLGSAQALEAWLLQRNDELAGLSQDGWAAHAPRAAPAQAAFAKALAKAREHGFFLGVNSSWLDR